MTAKEYFNEIRKLKTRIQSKITQAETLRELATNVSPNYSGMPHNPSKTTSPMADAICKAVDLEHDADFLKKELIDLEFATMTLISSLTIPEHQNILIRRYLRMEGWEDIARGMYCSESTVYRLHREAVREFESVLNEVNVDSK